MRTFVIPTRKRSIGLAFGTVLFGVLAGCGDDLARVSGTVTLDGEPLEGASVVFQPVDVGRPSRGVTDGRGNYELNYTPERKGAEIGEHVVQIRAEVVREDRHGENVAIGERVPRQYNDHSELSHTVKSGSNRIDFVLKSSGRAVRRIPRDDFQAGRRLLRRRLT